MREIKFRAWDKNWNKFSGGDEAFAISRLSERAGESNFELMQFTGLKDKNGKEIFEGDIIGADDIMDEFIGVIIFHEAKFCLDEVNYKVISDLDEYDMEVCEVIGNIYENPELLEKGK